MNEQFLVFLVLLVVVAAFVRQDFAFFIVYLFAGSFILGSWWSRRALRNVVYKRTFNQRAFLNETIRVRLEVTNTGLLPVVWLRIHESLPVDLTTRANFHRVLSLGAKKSTNYTYELNARKRGHYSVGPLFAFSSDLLGLLPEQSGLSPPDYLIIYPKIVPLTRMNLPSSSPVGALRHSQPIYEDPNRVMGKRNYVAGDSLRRIDWKSSASSGNLQVKLFEPSIALETSIFLDLNSDAYALKSRFNATELAIVIAASIANWITSKQQAVGLVSNGLDPLYEVSDSNQPFQMRAGLLQASPPRKGRAHLMRILDSLARVQAGPSLPLLDLLRRESVHLSWGTTVITITENLDEGFYDQFFQMRRNGLNLLLVLTGQGERVNETRRQAASQGFPCFQVSNESDLDIWRR